MGTKDATSQRYFRVQDMLGPEPVVANQPDGGALPDPSTGQQLREVNQRLVLATLQAHGLVEAAEAERAKTALSERRFRSLVDSLAAIVWTADASGWIRFDPRWHVLTGLRPAAPQSAWDWLEAVHAGDRERVRAAWSAAVSEGTGYECEHRLYRRDGSTAWVDTHAVAIRGEGGAVVEWTGLMCDITDRKIVEEARDRFIGVLGHDLRTPLTAIRMGADILAEGTDLTAPQKGAVALIRRCTVRMHRLIGDVLDFTRGRLGGGIRLDLRSASFGDACREAVNELRAVHPARRILLETEGDLYGHWDTGRVQQVVSNLVGNALEHGADPVEVIVTGEADDVVLEIRNANLGPPMPSDLLPLLFEPFRRGQNTVDSHGLGLGLYIVSEIVRAHGGTIVVTSSTEGGTMFSSRWSRRAPLRPGANRRGALPPSA